MNRRLPFVALLMCAAPSTGAAQAPPPTSGAQDSIIAVIQEFFTALEARDTATIRRLFLPDATVRRLLLPDARSVLIGGRPDSSVLGSAPIDEFLRRVSGARVRLRERMWDPQVLEHRGLAVVWTPYDFRLDDRFSHCGVDAFTLLRSQDGWRIAGLAYTVEPTGCPDGPASP
jgi:hypothetical protein